MLHQMLEIRAAIKLFVKSLSILRHHISTAILTSFHEILHQMLDKDCVLVCDSLIVILNHTPNHTTYSLTLYIWNGGFAFIWIYKWRSWASKYLLFRAVEHIETYFLSKRWREQGNVILFNPWQKELKRKELHRRVKATIRQVKMTMLLYINKNI